MQTSQETAERRAVNSITAADLLTYIKVLASDEFAGRCPGTEGEEKTIGYLRDFFDGLSKASGRNFEAHLQSVPATEIHSKPSLTLHLDGAQSLTLQAPQQYVASSLTLEPSVAIKGSEAVFVGYAVVAPEYGWDDYKGLDVRGKTLVMLCGDPQLPDESMFRGSELTYYGRWTYKYEMAAKLGAAAVFIIHETERAGYGYDVVKAGFGATHFALSDKAVAKKQVPIQGWFALDTAKDILSKSGFDFAELKKQALSKSFKPFPLKFKIDATIESTFRNFQSQNFVAVLPGTDLGSATAGSNSGSATVGSNSGAATVVTNSGVTSASSTATEHVVYMAHWDHFGVTDAGILSGALDNASGVASVMCIAKAFSLMPPLSRSVVFVV
jgi:Zn-dependent M28 family amino/carboxypeptidase